MPDEKQSAQPKLDGHAFYAAWVICCPLCHAAPEQRCVEPGTDRLLNYVHEARQAAADAEENNLGDFAR